MDKTKICTKCGVEKPWTKEFFYKHTKARLKSRCKKCCNAITAEWAKNNPEKIKQHRKNCKYKPSKDQVAKYAKSYYEKNKDKMKQSTRDWQKNNPEKFKEHCKKYRETHKEEMREYKRKNKHRWKSSSDYYRENREKILEKMSERYSSDAEYRLKLCLRRRIWKAMRAQRHRKDSNTADLIGCSIPEMKRHLESQFAEGMSWDNYGDWHIDHIKPCASFDLTDPEQQRECFHYTNLQPLWAIDNLRKGAKLLDTHDCDGLEDNSNE